MMIVYDYVNFAFVGLPVFGRHVRGVWDPEEVKKQHHCPAIMLSMILFHLRNAPWTRRLQMPLLRLVIHSWQDTDVPAMLPPNDFSTNCVACA